MIDQQTAKSLFDLTDGKSSIYYGTTTGTYANLENGDYLVDSTDGCTYRWDATNNTWVEVTKTGTLYTTCDTDASTANKVAQCNKAIALYEGLVVSVKFTKANTSTSALTLKVGDLAAKNIQVGNSNTSSTNKMLWAAGATITFIYNGEKWLFADQPQTYSASCDTGANTAAKSSSVSNAVVVNGTTVNVTFTYSNTASNATLDITNTSANAANISANGTSLSATSQYNWNAGATASFTFDGTKWKMNNTSALYNTNSYMKFESSGTAQGLMIANMTSGVVGNSSITSRNVLLQSDGLKIRNGQNVLASYGDSIIMYKPGTTTAAVNISSESATFNGIINATSGSFGGFTIDSDSIYSGTKGNSNTNLDITLSTAIFQRTIGGVDRSNLKFAIGANFGVKNDGTIYVGDGIFKGSVTATSLSTGGRTSSSTGTNGTYIDSTGNIYIGSTNATKLYANGNFQFGGSNGITYDGSNVILGSNVKLSWSSITDPHETQLPDWVNKVSTEISGDTVKTTNLYAADIIGDTIHGKNIYTGSHNKATSTVDGALIDNEGNIYVGPYDRTKGSCPFQVTKSGIVTARDVDLTGSITATSGSFTGEIIATDGSIGGFTIKSGYLTTNTNRTTYNSTSATGITIDGNGIGGYGSSSAYFTLTTDGKFTLGGSYGIRYVTSNNINYIYIGNGLSINLSDGSMAIDKGSHLVFNDGLITHGNIIASNKANGSKSTIRATGAYFLGSGSSDDAENWEMKITSGDTEHPGEANFALPISVKSSTTGNKVIKLEKDGKITCQSLSVTGNLSCRSFTPSSISTGSITGTSLNIGSSSNTIYATIDSNGIIKSAYSSNRYGSINKDESIYVREADYSYDSSTIGTYYSNTRYVRMSTSSNSAYFEVYYRYDNYVTISGAHGINVIGNGITADGTITGGSLVSKGNLTLKGTISGATTINASSTITGGSLVSKGGLTLSGDISGASNISASGTVTASTFIGKVRTKYSDNTSWYPIGTTTTNDERYCSVINTGLNNQSKKYVRVFGGFGASDNAQYYNDIFIGTSDLRLKDNVKDSVFNGLETIMKIRHRQFDWKTGGSHNDVGYIAQELKAIDPNLVDIADEDDDNAMYSVNTLYLLSVTTKALQELITEVDTLKSRIDELERTKGELNES